MEKKGFSNHESACDLQKDSEEEEELQVSSNLQGDRNRLNQDESVASGVVALRERHQAKLHPGARPKIPAPSELTQSPARQKIWVDRWEQTSINPVSDLGENTHGNKQVVQLVTGKPPFCVGKLCEPLHKQGSDTQPTKSRGTSAPKGLLSRLDGSNETGAVEHDQQMATVSAELPGELAEMFNGLDNGIFDTMPTATRNLRERLLAPPAAPRSSPTVQPTYPVYHLTNYASQNMTTGVTGFQLSDSGFFSYFPRDDSVMLVDDDSSSSSSSSSLSSIIRTEQFNASNTSQSMTSWTNQSTTILPRLRTYPMLPQTRAPMESHAELVTEAFAPSLPIREPPSESNETSEAEEGYDAGSSSSVTDSDISNHGSEASSRLTATRGAASFPPAGRGCVIENDDASDENVDLVERQQKENEKLQASVIFLVERLQTLTAHNRYVEDKKSHLKQALSQCRSRCAQLEELMEEQAVVLNRSAELEAQSQRLIRMMEESLDSEREEFHRFQEELRREKEAHAVRISNLERQTEELHAHLIEAGIAMTDKNETIREQQEEFNRLTEECEGLRQERDGLKQECEGLRQECEGLKQEPNRLKETIRTLRQVVYQLDSPNTCTVANNEASGSASGYQELQISTLNCPVQSSSGERVDDDGADGGDDGGDDDGSESSQQSDSGDPGEEDSEIR